MKTIPSSLFFVFCSTLLFAAEINYPGESLRKDPLEDGQSLYAGASDNDVSVDYVPGGTVPDPDSVFGGFTRDGTSENNQLTFKNGHVSRFVFGGFSFKGNVRKNSVVFSGGVAADAAIGKLCGGQTKNGDLTDNSVMICGGRIGGDVYGGDADADGSATRNLVVIGDGKLEGFVNGGGVSGIGIARKNRVAILGGSVGMGVSGGFAHFAAGAPPKSSEKEKTNSVFENAVFVSGKTEIDGNVSGGFVLDSEGSADRNSVKISGGTIRGNVFGGRAFRGEASGNTVSISGGKIRADNRAVYGGYVHKPENGCAKNNTVAISGSPDLDTITLRGNNLPTWKTDGNTLNFKGFRGSVLAFSHFQTVNIDKDSVVTVVGEGPHEILDVNNEGRLIFTKAQPVIHGKVDGNPVE